MKTVKVAIPIKVAIGNGGEKKIVDKYVEKTYDQSNIKAR